MALTADQITAQNFKDFYTQILPYLNKGNGGTSDTPLGQVAFFDDLVAPYGWLVADGSTYNISDYPDLANQYERVHGSKNYWGGNGTTTFAVPNWQGEFLRASGTNSHTGQGYGGTVGEHQDATKIPSLEYFYSEGAGEVRLTRGSDSSARITNTDAWMGSSSSMSAATQATIQDMGNTGYNLFAARPTNTSLLLCIKAIPSSEMNTYSLTERRVGTWIDGKPLYQKTVLCGAMPNKTIKSIPHGISNLKYVVRYWGVLSQANAASWRSFAPTMTQDNNEDMKIMTTISATNINICARKYDFETDYGANAESYITIQYTKTTD